MKTRPAMDPMALDVLVRQQGAAISEIVAAMAATDETVRMAVDALCRTHTVVADAVKQLMSRVEMIEGRLNMNPKEGASYE